MSSRKHLQAVILALFFYSGHLSSQWIQNTGPYDGDIGCLAFQGKTIYAGTQAGVYISTDNGTNWNLSSKLNNAEVISLTVNKGTIYTGTYYDGVYVSADSGVSWSAMNEGLQYRKVPALATIGENILAGTTGGLFLSADQGHHWNSTGLNVRIANIAVSGTNMFAIGQGMYISPDSGKSWTSIITPAIFNGTLAAGNGKIYAGTNDGQLYASADDGRNWSVITLPTVAGFQTITSLGVNGANIYVVHGGILFTSIDSGLHWNRLSDESAARCFAFREANIFMGTRNGVKLSADNGVSWSLMNAGITNVDVFSLFVKGSSIYAATSKDVFLSLDKGATWKIILSGASFTSFLQIDSTLYISSDNGIYATTNNGDSWRQSLPVTEVCYSLVAYGKYLFAGTSVGIYRSADNGISWSRLNFGFYDRKVRSMLVLGKNIYAGTWGSWMWMSADSGATWNLIVSGLKNSSIWSLAAIGNDLYAGTLGGVFVTSNNGADWKAVNNGLNDTIIYSLRVSGNTLYAGTHTGLYRTSNKGEQWEDVSIGLPIPNRWSLVNCIAESDSNLYVGTSVYGLWRRPLSQLATEVESEKLHSTPVKFVLAQNYPNPFNPSTTISFTIPSKSHVSLKIYDVMGREVAKLVSEEMSAGTYLRRWNATGMASGMYFYRLQAGPYSETRRLEFVR